MKRLTVSGIQIYFDEQGRALFDGRIKQRTAVQRELEEAREFIDRWIEASEEPRPRGISPGEEEPGG